MSQERCLGVIRIGEMVVAIPAAQLQEVVSDPLPLSPLPDAPPFVRGQVVLHDRMIAPVIDLQQLLFPTAPVAGRAPLLVFLRNDVGRVAIFADEVLRVVNPPDDRFARISTGGPETPLFRQSFQDGTQVINLLEVQALTEYSGVRLAGLDDASPADELAAEESIFTLFRLGELVFAVDIVAASHAMLVPPLGPERLPTPLLHGFFTRLGRQTALIDLKQALGLAAGADGTLPTRMLAIEQDGRAFAVGITELLGMERLSLAMIQSFGACGMPAAHLYRGTAVSRNHGKLLVLDHQALFAAEGIRSLVALHDGGIATEAKKTVEQRNSFIVYRASGNSLASRMEELEAVIAYPSDFVAVPQERHPFLGFFTWQKRSVALMDLGVVLGESRPETDCQTARVLIVRQGANYLGYLVSRVESLQEAAPKPLPRFAASGTFPKNPFCQLPPIKDLITVKVEAGKFNASVLDLLAIQTAAPQAKIPIAPDQPVSVMRSTSTVATAAELLSATS